MTPPRFTLGPRRSRFALPDGRCTGPPRSPPPPPPPPRDFARSRGVNIPCPKAFVLQGLAHNFGTVPGRNRIKLMRFLLLYLCDRPWLTCRQTCLRSRRLFEQHRRQIHAHIFALVLNEQDALEIFQEASLTIWQKFDKYQPGTDFRAWTYRIAYYHVLKRRERYMQRPALLGDELLELIDKESVAMSDQLDARSDALVKCREKLPARDRELLERYYRPEASGKQVAYWQRMSVRTMYRAVRRIHDALYNCVTRVLREAAGG